MYKITVSRIFKSLGGVRKFARQHAKIAKKCGFEPLPENTVRSWVRENRIRWERLPEVYTVAHSLGISLVMEQFLEAKGDMGWVLSLGHLRLAPTPTARGARRPKSSASK